MQREIIINGINMTELKARAAALAQEQQALRDSIKQGASQFIADNMKEALEAVATMKEAETKEDALAAATKAAELLEDISFVSDVSGVAYTLPHGDSSYCYGGYSSDDIITSILEDGENENIEYSWRDKDSPFTRLYNIAESMEQEVIEWNSSYC